MTEDQIERSFERMCNALDRRLMAGEITQEQYDTQYATNKRWCEGAVRKCEELRMSDDTDLTTAITEHTATLCAQMYLALADKYGDALEDPNNPTTGVRPFILSLTSLLGSYVGNVASGMVEPRQGLEIILGEVHTALDNIARAVVRMGNDPSAPLPPEVSRAYEMDAPVSTKGTKH
jgi:hypothetical protein